MKTFVPHAPELLLAVGIAAATIPSHADPLDRSTNRLIRESAGSLRAPGISILAAPPEAPAPPPSMQLTLGIAHEHDQDGTNSTTTPFAFDYQPYPGAPWQFEISGDGHTRQSAPGTSSVHGLADVSGLASYRYKLNEKLAVKAALELTVPSHGDVGSTTWSQDARLIATYQATAALTPILGAIVTHTDTRTPGVSSYGRMLLAGAEYDWGPKGNDYSLIAKMKRRLQGGATSKISLNVEFDFPLPANLSGAFIVDQGLSSGARHTSGEFDVVFSF